MSSAKHILIVLKIYSVYNIIAHAYTLVATLPSHMLFMMCIQPFCLVARLIVISFVMIDQEINSADIKSVYKGS